MFFKLPAPIPFQFHITVRKDNRITIQLSSPYDERLNAVCFVPGGFVTRDNEMQACHLVLKNKVALDAGRAMGEYASPGGRVDLADAGLKSLENEIKTLLTQNGNDLKTAESAIKTHVLETAEILKAQWAQFTHANQSAMKLMNDAVYKYNAFTGGMSEMQVDYRQDKPLDPWTFVVMEKAAKREANEEALITLDTMQMVPMNRKFVKAAFDTAYTQRLITVLAKDAERENQQDIKALKTAFIKEMAMNGVETAERSMEFRSVYFICVNPVVANQQSDLQRCCGVGESAIYSAARFVPIGFDPEKDVQFSFNVEQKRYILSIITADGIPCRAGSEFYALPIAYDLIKQQQAFKLDAIPIDAMPVVQQAGPVPLPATNSGPKVRVLTTTSTKKAETPEPTEKGPLNENVWNFIFYHLTLGNTYIDFLIPIAKLNFYFADLVARYIKHNLFVDYQATPRCVALDPLYDSELLGVRMLNKNVLITYAQNEPVVAWDLIDLIRLENKKAYDYRTEYIKPVKVNKVIPPQLASKPICSAKSYIWNKALKSFKELDKLPLVISKLFTHDELIVAIPISEWEMLEISCDENYTYIAVRDLASGLYAILYTYPGNLTFENVFANPTELFQSSGVYLIGNPEFIIPPTSTQSGGNYYQSLTIYSERLYETVMHDRNTRTTHHFGKLGELLFKSNNTSFDKCRPKDISHYSSEGGLRPVSVSDLGILSDRVNGESDPYHGECTTQLSPKIHMQIRDNLFGLWLPDLKNIRHNHFLDNITIASCSPDVVKKPDGDASPHMLKLEAAITSRRHAVTYPLPIKVHPLLPKGAEQTLIFTRPSTNQVEFRFFPRIFLKIPPKKPAKLDAAISSTAESSDAMKMDGACK